MLVLIGLIVTFAAVITGFLLEGGNLYVLVQPAELLIVGGTAGGITLVANPPAVIRKMGRGRVAVFRSPPCTRDSLLTNLRMLYEVLGFSQCAGMMELE